MNDLDMYHLNIMKNNGLVEGLSVESKGKADTKCEVYVIL